MKHVSFLAPSQLSQLCEKLDELWLENSDEVILFTWTQFLIDESLDVLGLTSPITLETDALLRRTSRQTSQECGATSTHDVAQTSFAEDELSNSSVNGAQSSQMTGASPAVPSSGANADAERPIDPRTVQTIASARHLILAIIEHDRLERQKAFNVAMYCCNVCFTEKQGVDCINFMGCDHVYCKQCMQEYFKVQIGEGNVNCLNCPNTDCDSQALPSQVS